MTLVSVLVLVVLVISAILLTLIVLIQDDQGGGIGGMFGGGESNTPFGSRTGNVLTRGTAILAAIFLVSAFALAWFNRSGDEGNIIGRARAQQREQTLSDTDWWVDTGEVTAPLAAPDTPASVDAGPEGAGTADRGASDTDTDQTSE